MPAAREAEVERLLERSRLHDHVTILLPGQETKSLSQGLKKTSSYTYTYTQLCYLYIFKHILRPNSFLTFEEEVASLPKAHPEQVTQAARSSSLHTLVPSISQLLCCDSPGSLWGSLHVLTHTAPSRRPHSTPPSRLLPVLWARSLPPAPSL